MALNANAEASDLGPVVQRRLPDSVAAQLQRLIDDGQFRPGDRLPPERELAITFNVSRASMREALNQLVMRGMIDRRPGLGTTVLARDLSGRSSEVRGLAQRDAALSDAWDFRSVIEPTIAARAASRRTRADVIQLDEIVRLTDHDESYSSFPTLDRKFHELIARSCHNPLLTALVELSLDWVDATRDKSFQTRKRWVVSRQGHRQVFDAIRDGNPGAAALAMTKHLHDVAQLQRQKSATK